MDHSVVHLTELDDQTIEMLPPRETLFVNINVGPVIGVNLAFAVNAATINSNAVAYANQVLAGMQVST